MNKKTILLTGGHLSPLLAILPELKKTYRLVVAGRSTVFNNINSPSLEYQILSNNPELKFYSLFSGRFTKGLWHKIPQELWLFGKGLKQSFKILNQEKPALVLSFGGYLSVPICLAAKIKGIPIRLHEQTISPGKANLFLSQLAEKIFVTFPGTEKYFPKHKVVLSGIAVRAEYAKQQQPAFFKRTAKPLLLIMGGSSGSHNLNLLIEPLIPQLTKQFQLVHQIGDNQFNDFQRLKKQQSLNYLPLKYLMPEHIGYFYHQTDLVISRSGANTFFELIKFKLPAVLLPLPWSANNEQLKHAQILARAKVANIFDQKQFTDQFYQLIIKTSKVLPTFKQNYQKLQEYAQLIKSPEVFSKQLLG